MKKVRITIVAFLLMLVGIVALSGFNSIPVKAVSDNVGVFAPEEVPNWVKGHEEVVKNKFVAAYTDALFTVDPDSTVKNVDLTKARVILYQDFGTEGTIFLNDVEGKALIVKDQVAIAELKYLLGLTGETPITDQFLKALLLDVVVSGEKTYYVTDRRNADGIFYVDTVLESEVEVTKAIYLDKRIGVGAHDYGDVTWNEFAKGYKAATIHMSSLGLPIDPVVRQRYTTANLNGNGTYVLTDGNKVYSEKEHTAQQFENGWLIEARIRVLNGDGTLGSNQNVQHGAAPILNDMYALVTGLADNADLSKTGAPVSVEFLVEGIRYQNFEYGYVKVEAGVATFVEDLVVDSHATEMNRRIGAGENFNNWLNKPGDWQLAWERLRVGYNFREKVGELIRAGRKPYQTSEADPLGDGRIHHVPHEFNGLGVVHIFKDGYGENEGWGNLFLVQTQWYNPVYEIAGEFNKVTIPTAGREALGRPIEDKHEYYNAVYQAYEKGIAYTDRTGINTWVLNVDLEAFLDGAATFEEALLAKGIAESHHDVKFVDHDDTEIEVVNVAHGAGATAPTNPSREHYTFDKWDKEYSEVLHDITVKALYKPINYVITYELDGGVNHIDNIAEANIESNFELKAATKDGLTFMGWFEDAEFTTPITHLQAITTDKTIYAKFVEEVTAEDIVGVFAPGSVPAWVKGYELIVKEEFFKAYTDSAFTAVPTEYVVSVNYGRTRVMLYQLIGTEGVIVLNEREGKAIAVTDPVFLAALPTLLGDPNTQGVLLSVVESEGTKYFVTDKGIISFNELGEVQAFEFVIGVGDDLPRFEGNDALLPIYLEAILNDFNNAYKFAENFMQPLGLPLEKVVMKDYTTLDLKDDGLPVEGNVTSAKQYYSQEFTNGYILMGSHNRQIQHGAAPIMKDFYNLVVALEGNTTLDLTGAPVSIEFNIDGVRLQNFEYGYVKVVDGVATFVEGWVVDSKGYEINRRVGMPLRFINWHWDAKNKDTYLIGWERLRVSQEFRELVGQMLKDGQHPYNTSAADPFGDEGIHNIVNRGGGSSGVWMIMKHGDGPALGWGNVFLLQGYWYNKPQYLMPELNISQFVDDKDGIGRPSEAFKVLYNAKYQVFDYGVGYIDGINPNPVLISGEEFTAWMGTYNSVEEAMLGHGIAEAEHTVRWLDHDGTELKVEQVPHGQPATPPEDPTREGFIFAGWTPEEFDSILLPNRTYTATYGAEVGEPQSGTHQFINFDSDGVTATFWYEDSEQKITVNATLYDAFRAKKLTMAESITVSGIPIYADETNLVTTQKWFYIEEGVVKLKDFTIGSLPTDVETIVEIPTSAPIGTAERKIIQDSFGDAFAFAFDRGKHQLGLPLGPITLEKEYPNPDNTEVFYHILVQEFEHGKIYQQGYNRAAFPIYGDMLTAFETHAKGGINGIGTPYSRQYEYEGKVFQNFKYGWIIIENGEVTVVDEEDKQLDFYMNEVDKKFGRWVNRSDARRAHADFEHEFLRTYEAYIEVHSRWTKERSFVFGLIVEPNVIAWNTYGASQGFSMSSSTSNQWGQTRFTPIPYLSPYASPHPVHSGILDTYAALGGNEAAGPGYPLADDFTLETTITHNDKEVKFNVTYQNFERGYIRTYILGDSSESEYFVGYKVSATGEHINLETNEVEETPEWILRGLIDGPVVSRDGLIAKLNELKALRAQTAKLEGDLKDLPSNQYFANENILNQIDQRIETLESILAKEELTEQEIEDGINTATSAITLLKNQRQAGQGTPVDPGTDEPKGLSTGAIIAIVIASVLVVGAGVFALIKFVFLKKKQ